MSWCKMLNSFDRILSSTVIVFKPAIYCLGNGVMFVDRNIVLGEGSGPILKVSSVEKLSPQKKWSRSVSFFLCHTSDKWRDVLITSISVVVVGDNQRQNRSDSFVGNCRLSCCGQCRCSREWRCRCQCRCDVAVDTDAMLLSMPLSLAVLLAMPLALDW